MNNALSSLSEFRQNRMQSKPELLKQESGETEEEFSVDKSSDSGESTSGKDNELKKAANKVEGFFIGYMMKQMRETVKRTKGLYERGQAEKIFRSRLDKKLAQEISQNKDFGIAESIYDQFSASPK